MHGKILSRKFSIANIWMIKKEYKVYMADITNRSVKHTSVRELPRNVWAVGLTSFFMEACSFLCLGGYSSIVSYNKKRGLSPGDASFISSLSSHVRN